MPLTIAWKADAWDNDLGLRIGSATRADGIASSVPYSPLIHLSIFVGCQNPKKECFQVNKSIINTSVDASYPQLEVSAHLNCRFWCAFLLVHRRTSAKNYVLQPCSRGTTTLKWDNSFEIETFSTSSDFFILSPIGPNESVAGGDNLNRDGSQFVAYT